MHSFTGLTNTLSGNPQDHFFWITIDIPSSSTDGNSLTVAAIPSSGITIDFTNTGGGVLSGSGAIGGAQTFLEPPVATVGSDVTICSGQSTNISVSNISGSLAPYDVSWNNSGGNCTNVASNGDCIKSVSPSNSTSFTATITSSNGCTAQFTQVVTVATQPTASIDYPGNNVFCATGSVSVNQTGQTGGVYSATPSGLSINTSTGQINLGTSAVGTYTINYDFSLGSCSGLATTSVTINTQPTASINYSASTFCATGAASVTQTGQTGGTYSATPNGLSIDANSGQIDLSASTAGNTYTVTYTFSLGSCIGTATFDVTITSQPNPTINYNGPFCPKGTANVIQTGPSGGTYSSVPVGLSINVNTGQLNLFASNPGTYTVTYTVSAGSCSGSASTTVVVNSLPVANISYAANPFCATGNGTVTQTGQTGGTYFSTPSAGININATNGSLSLAGSVSGNYIISYVFTGSNSCVDTTSTTITVLPLPIATIDYPGNNTFCATGITSVVQTGQTGGTYSALPAGLSINAGSGQINLGASSPGTYTVTYSFSDGICSNTTSTNVTINALPVATIDYQGNNTFCKTGSAAVIQTGQTGGTYSASPTGLSINSTSGLINLTASTAGVFTIKYVFSVGNCSDSAFTNVTINALPVATINYAGTPFCNLGTGAVNIIGQTGGVFSATPTGVILNSTSGSINLSQSTQGNYIIKYVFSNSTSGCTDSTTTNIVINEASIAPSIITASDTVICNGSSATLTLQGGSLGTNAKFKWYLNGCGNGAPIDSSTSITISPQNNGTIPITQEFFVRAENTQSPCTANTGCASRTIIINPVPERINLFPDTICSGQSLNDTIVSSFTTGVTYAWSTSGPSIITGNFTQSPPTANNINTDILFNSTTNQQPTVTYIDTLIFTNIIQCLSISTHNVVVNPAAPKALVTDFVSATGSIPDNLCGGTQFNSFNVTNAVGGATYNWQVTPSNVVVHQPNSTNTVISFPDSSVSYIATITAISFNEFALGGCPNDSTSFNINVAAGDPIQESKIILKQPGNLLVYLDNTPLGFQWGFDSKNTFLPSKIEGQVYQVLDHPVTLPFDTLTRDYWVIVYQNNCITKVYYNGPYSETKSVENAPIPDEINLSAMPNPNNGIFDLVISGNIYQNINICIWNNLGQQVYQEDIYKSEPLQKYSLILPRLSTGLYMVDVKGNHGEQATHKILIK